MKNLWLIILFLIVIGSVWWITDSRLESKEWEEDSWHETGKTYKELGVK